MGRAVAEFRLLSPRCQNQKRILGGGQWRNFDLPRGQNQKRILGEGSGGISTFAPRRCQSRRRHSAVAEFRFLPPRPHGKTQHVGPVVAVLAFDGLSSLI